MKKLRHCHPMYSGEAVMCSMCGGNNKLHFVITSNKLPSLKVKQIFVDLYLALYLRYSALNRSGTARVTCDPHVQ